MRNAPLIMLFLSPFSLCVWCQTTQRDPRENLKPERGKSGQKKEWEKHGLKTRLRVFPCVRLSRTCPSWKETMSAIYTWACLLLWISLATQDKTPGETQTPLCPAAKTDLQHSQGLKRTAGFPYRAWSSENTTICAFLQLRDFFSLCNIELSQISHRPYSNFSPESWRQVWAQDGNILPPQQVRKLWHSWA